MIRKNKKNVFVKGTRLRRNECFFGCVPLDVVFFFILYQGTKFNYTGRKVHALNVHMLLLIYFYFVILQSSYNN